MECFGFWKTLAHNKEKNSFFVHHGKSPGYSFIPSEKRFNYINKSGKSLTGIDIKEISFENKLFIKQFYSVIFIDYNSNFISEEGELLLLRFENDN